MRRKGSIIFLLLAVAFAAVAAWGSHRWMQHKASADAAQRAMLAPIVVAKTDVKTGDKLSQDNLEVIQRPAPTLPPGHFSQIEQLTDRVVRQPILRGQVVLVSRLALKGKAGGMSAVVPTGYRAMTLRVNEVIGVAGFVQPGDRVDVLVTVDKGQFREDPTSRVVLQDVPVLAVGKELPQEPTEDKKSKNARVTVVTMQVNPEQGERLALAATEGKIILTLRNLADRSNGDTQGIKLSALVATAEPPEPEPMAEEPPQPLMPLASPKPGIEVIKGVKRSVQDL